MNKHTPGPWVDVGDGWIDGADGESVVEYAGCGSHEAWYKNPADNALILAAPDLLEALEHMIAWANCRPGTYPGGYPGTMAAAAIARARGEA